MSEDELETLNTLINKDVYYFKDVFDNRVRPAVGKLLDLYQKEKKKNEELSIIKEEIRVLQNNGLIDEQYIVIANWNLKNTTYKHLLDDYISKDKIRAKIKELEKEREEYKGSQEWEIQDDIDAQINILEELLEEE